MFYFHFFHLLIFFPENHRQEKKEGYAGDISTYWEVRIPPPALFAYFLPVFCLSATTITSKAPITLALGLLEANNPKTIPRLVTVEGVAPKLNLLGSLGNCNFTEQPSYSFTLIKKICIFKVIFNFH
jgi:hypothetical protein